MSEIDEGAIVSGVASAVMAAAYGKNSPCSARGSPHTGVSDFLILDIHKSVV
jgi:hypothetical protein